MFDTIRTYLRADARLTDRTLYLEDFISSASEALRANAYYYNNREWAEEYLQYVHRSDPFKHRWQAAIGDWNNKVVVDIGCGPGNLLATLQGKPRLIIGVDVASRSLDIARKFGYVPVLADAARLPFTSGFADIVTLNATLHHCDDMEAVLKEAARLVKPGGLLVTDHDPQLSAWNYKGPAKLMWNAREWLYRILKKGFHKTAEQQYWGLASEVHHKPGHGVTKQFFEAILIPRHFKVQVFPHNHVLGAEVLEGNWGKAPFKFRVGNLLSGRNPDMPGSALSLMCIARKSA